MFNKHKVIGLIMINIVNEYNRSLSVINSMLSDETFLIKVRNIADLWIKALKNNKKIMFCGNGGSAADSQHLAAELVSRFYFDRPGLYSIALTVDTSILTAVGNDYGFDKTFARQVEAIGQPEDILVGISTSGKSRNVIEALKCAKDKNITTVAFLGESGNDMAKLAEYCLNIPSKSTPKIQEGHIITGHIICALVEESIFGSKTSSD